MALLSLLSRRYLRENVGSLTILCLVNLTILLFNDMKCLLNSMRKVLGCTRPINILTSALHFKLINEVHGSLSLESQSTNRCHGQLQPSLWGTMKVQGLVAGFEFACSNKWHLSQHHVDDICCGVSCCCLQDR